jgi:hypothetical protein
MLRTRQPVYRSRVVQGTIIFGHRRWPEHEEHRKHVPTGQENCFAVKQTASEKYHVPRLKRYVCRPTKEMSPRLQRIANHDMHQWRFYSNQVCTTTCQTKHVAGWRSYVEIDMCMVLNGRCFVDCDREYLGFVASACDVDENFTEAQSYIPTPCSVAACT